MYEIKSNRSSYHIDGLAPKSKGLGVDNGQGHVSYFAESTCGALTRGRFWTDFQTEDLAEAVAKFELLARVYNRKACANCAKAAKEVLDQTDRAADNALDAALSKITGAELELIRAAIAANRI